MKAGNLARYAASAKLNDYKKNYIFLPFTYETLGAWCTEALKFALKIGDMLNMSTCKENREQNCISNKESAYYSKS